MAPVYPEFKFKARHNLSYKGVSEQYFFFLNHLFLQIVVKDCPSKLYFRVLVVDNKPFEL